MKKGGVTTSIKNFKSDADEKEKSKGRSLVRATEYIGRTP